MPAPLSVSAGGEGSTRVRPSRARRLKAAALRPGIGPLPVATDVFPKVATRPSVPAARVDGRHRSGTGARNVPRATVATQTRTACPAGHLPVTPGRDQKRP
jgi:hypothetical protein